MISRLERRRFETIGLLKKMDLNQSEVARRLHVCRQTVRRWVDAFKEALKKAVRAGESRN